MKRLLLIWILLGGGGMRASATLSQTFSGGTVAAGNPIGSTFTGDFTQANPGDVVLNLTVSLNVSGGYASGFYAYLIAPNGSQVTLLNYPGVSDSNPIGNTTQGLNLTLATGGAAITYTSDLMNGGTYAAYGSLSFANGSSANGNWTLYFADPSSGDNGDATLNSWNMDITVVPEPVNAALLVFGALAVGFLLIGRVKSVRTVGWRAAS